MANYVTIEEKIVAEKWTGTNYETIFNYLGWDVWDKRDNSASGANFSIDNYEGGDGLLYIKIGIVMTVVNVGDYIVKNDDGTLSIKVFELFEAKYRLGYNK